MPMTAFYQDYKTTEEILLTQDAAQVPLVKQQLTI